MFLLKNIDCVYLLELPQWDSSNEHPWSIFWAEIWKISEFLSENFQFLVVKFSVYLNRHVFVMVSDCCRAWSQSTLFGQGCSNSLGEYCKYFNSPWKIYLIFIRIALLKQLLWLEITCFHRQIRIIPTFNGYKSLLFFFQESSSCWSRVHCSGNGWYI